MHCAITTLVLHSSYNAFARDLQARLGLGYNAQFANYSAVNGVPGISAKYGLTRDIAIEGILGINTETPTNSVTAIKLFKNLFMETNLNFYILVGGGILSANSRGAAELLGGFGSEFFIPGLESLGFAMEFGGSFNNISGSFTLKTMGMSFLNAGIHFYF